MDTGQGSFGSNPNALTITTENGQYTQHDFLGKGGYGIVHRATRTHDNLVVAMKMTDYIPGMTIAKRECFITELDALRKLRHPYITSYVDHATTNHNLYIMLELAPYGDLEGLIRIKQRQLSETEVGVMTCQCLSALHFIHSNGFIHRDVKLSNILVQSLEPPVFKMTDFGTAKLLDQVESATSYVGTCRYMAPEVRRLERWKMRGLGPKTRMMAALGYDNKADIWSMGAVLISICYPHGVDVSNEAQVPALLRQTGVPDDAQGLIVKMMRQDATARPSAQEALLNEPWCQRHIREALK